MRAPRMREQNQVMKYRTTCTRQPGFVSFFFFRRMLPESLISFFISLSFTFERHVSGGKKIKVATRRRLMTHSVFSPLSRNPVFCSFRFVKNNSRLKWTKEGEQKIHFFDKWKCLKLLDLEDTKEENRTWTTCYRRSRSLNFVFLSALALLVVNENRFITPQVTTHLDRYWNGLGLNCDQ